MSLGLQLGKLSWLISGPNGLSFSNRLSPGFLLGLPAGRFQEWVETCKDSWGLDLEMTQCLFHAFSGANQIASLTQIQGKGRQVLPLDGQSYKVTFVAKEFGFRERKSCGQFCKQCAIRQKKKPHSSNLLPKNKRSHAKKEKSTGAENSKLTQSINKNSNCGGRQLTETGAWGGW